MDAYAMTVRPPETLATGRLDGLTASERHVATLIDYATNVFRVSSLRPEMHYWQRRLAAGTAEPAQIAAFLSKVLAELGSVPRRAVNEERTTVTFAQPAAFAGRGLKPERRALSKAAAEAARVLFYYYDMSPRRPGHAGSDADRMHVAELVDATLGLFRVTSLEGMLREKKAALMAGRLTAESVQTLMRSVGVYFDKMPTYTAGEDELKLLA
jgi:hypothetical protein